MKKCGNDFDRKTIYKWMYKSVSEHSIL